LPARTIGRSFAIAALCHAAPRHDACQFVSLPTWTPSHSRTSHNAGGPAALETVTKISFSPV
jgi:hypothetical protein